jgi:hypothetical protein
VQIANSQTDQVWAHDPLDECFGLISTVEIELAGSMDTRRHFVSDFRFNDCTGRNALPLLRTDPVEDLLAVRRA